jgi:hypothetical protein
MIEEMAQLKDSMPMVFGDEWAQLSADDRGEVLHDVISEHVVDLAEYKRCIGAGNLASYAATLRAGRRRSMRMRLVMMIDALGESDAYRVLQDMKACLLENSQRNDTLSALDQWLERAMHREDTDD